MSTVLSCDRRLARRIPAGSADNIGATQLIMLERKA